MHIAAGPIEQSTVLELNNTGHLISQWGEKMYNDYIKYHNVVIIISCRFYMPHGLTIDSKGNYWITDVAMHQVSFCIINTLCDAHMSRFLSSLHSGIKHLCLVLHFLLEMIRVTFVNLLLLPWIQ